MTAQFEVGVRLTADGKALVGAAREAEQALDRVGQAAERASAKSAGGAERPKIGAGAEATKKEAAEAEAALKKLLVAIDPVYAKQVKFEQGQAALNRALKAGVIDQRQFTLGLANFETRLGLVEPKLARFAHLKSVAGGVLGGIVGGGAVGVIDRALGLIGSFIDRLDRVGPRIAKLVTDAKALGLTVGNLQGVELTGRQSGLAGGDATKGLLNFDEVIRDAAVGEGKYRHFLEQIGIRARGASGEIIKVGDAMRILASRFHEFSAADQRTLAEAFFGDGKFAEIVGGWNQAIGAADRLGTALGDKVAVEAKRAYEELRRINEISLEKMQAQIDRMGSAWIRTKTNANDAFTFLLRVAQVLDPNFVQDAYAKTGEKIGQALSESAEQAWEGLKIWIKSIDGDSQDVAKEFVAWAAALGGSTAALEQVLELIRKVKNEAAEAPSISKPMERLTAQQFWALTHPNPVTTLKPKPRGGGAGGEDPGKIVEELAQRARAQEALQKHGQLAAEVLKQMERLDRAGATAMQKSLAKAHVEREAMARGLADLDAMEKEHRRNVEAIEAELAGHHQVAEAIRMKAQLEKTHGKAFADASEGRIAALAAEKVALERGAEQYRALTGEISQFAGATLAALNDAAVRPFEAGEKAAKRWLDTLTRGLQDLQRLLFQLAVVNPFQNWLDGGGRPTFSTLVGRLFGGVFGGGAAGADAVPDALRVDVMHVGGLVGAGGGPGRLVPALAFAGAPRLHGGGILPGERPAILTDGEGVFTPRQMSNADGLVRALALMAARGAGEDGRVSVQIYDQRTGNGRPEASAEQTRGAGGEREIRVFLRDAVREGIARGDYDGVAGQAWGVTRRGAGR